jgi:integrase/recombinase XerC
MARWLAHLTAERRMSGQNRRSLRTGRPAIPLFIAEHLGGTPNLAELAKLTPQDVRAFMAARRADGIGGRSLMRALGGNALVRAVSRRNHKGKVGALAAVRAPKVPKTLPKPLHIEAARKVVRCR